MNWIKVVAINLFILFALLGAMLMAPPAIYYTYSAIKGNASIGAAPRAEDSRASLELFADYEWASKHFMEFRQLDTTYHDFFVWRRDDFDGETITINDGIRDTSISQIADQTNSHYWFFGGSTTWGTGVPDGLTYPSIFADRTGAQVTNFGETGYIARQSLDYLVSALSEPPVQRSLNGTHVIFYDGVNDVANKCRAENDGFSTAREAQIRTALNTQGRQDRYDRYSFLSTFSQIVDLLTAAGRRLNLVSDDDLASDSNKKYSCATSPSIAKNVAESMVNTWEVAAKIVSSSGGQFTAILQPVGFIGNPEIDYLNIDSARPGLRAQYEAVYPIVREIASERDFSFYDLSGVYDKCDDCYIDFCHVGPQAHHILVDELEAVIVR